MKPIARQLSLIVLLVAFAMGGGCAGTVTPKVVTSTQASFDGNEQNSGVISVQPNGYVVTAHFRDRYNALIADYGTAFTPPLSHDAGIARLTDYTWLIDREHMIKMIEMNTWRKSGRKPDR